ncbi:MAG: DUF3592 domain-containing protein [Gemmataceae bacterium]
MPIDLPPPPRQLRRRSAVGCGVVVGRWFLRLFITPHCIVGIGLIFNVLYIPLVLLFGTDLPGRVTDHKTYQSKGTTHYQVTYSYPVNEIDYIRVLDVNSEQYASLEVGQPFPVRVLPAWPRMHPQPLGPDNPWRNMTGMLLLVFFWNGILSIFVWLAWVAPWRLRQLVKYGSAVTGHVFAKETRRGKGTTYFVRYNYVVPPEESADPFVKGQSCEGRMDVTIEDFKAAEEGQAVTVLYDPRKPKRSLIYDFAEYEAVW